MKRIFALLLSLAVLFSCLAVTAGAMFDPSTVYDVKAQSAYIVNTDTNIIVYEKDSEKQVSAGGLTKYMTIALVLTNYADQLDSTFTMPFAISDYVHSTDNADMRSGETFTYREALYAMVTRNANEAAMGLAYELSGGDLAGWVSQMNTLSQRIGTTNSTWTDACGLDSGNTTTAVDMYLILRYLMSFDAFKEISAAPTFTMPAKEKHAKSFVLLSQNVALNKTSGGRFYRSAMQGGMCDVMAYKNDSGDQSYVSWANKDGATYIFCIMQSPDTCDDYGYSNRRPALYETTKLIDWVFESFSIQAALDTDQALAEIPVKYSSDTDTLQLYPADSMMTLLPSTGDGSVTQKYFHLPDYATAPIQQGDVVGTVELKLAGETIGVVNLIAGQDVHQNALLFTVSKVQAFFHSLYLKVVIVVLEWNNAFAGMSPTDKWVQAFFNATCPRTAGFSSVGMTTFSMQTLLLMVILMMIGGGTQSTAGGVKVNVFAVVMLNLRAILIGADKVTIFNRELSHDSIRRSNATLILYLLVVFAGIFSLSLLEPQASIMALVFECTSALSTVGSSLDLTPTLGSDSKLIIIILMFVGRVGVLTLMSSIIKQKKITKYRYPSDNIIIN